MTELPSDYRDYFVALAEGRIPWSNWPRWFALHARNLARLLGREQLARVKQDPQKAIPQLLSTLYRAIGIDPGQTFLNGAGRPMYILDDRDPVTELLA